MAPIIKRDLSERARVWWWKRATRGSGTRERKKEEEKKKREERVDPREYNTRFSVVLLTLGRGNLQIIIKFWLLLLPEFLLPDFEIDSRDSGEVSQRN